jgi:hypothetical protein
MNDAIPLHENRLSGHSATYRRKGKKKGKNRYFSEALQSWPGQWF